MRDHGGNLDWAIARHGGPREAWLDLSTGINPRPYPLPDISAAAWAALPTRTARQELEVAAQRAYGARHQPLAVAGAQAAIQAVPRLRPPGAARIVAPTYNEHAACLSDAGWQVREVDGIEALAGADLAILVNPNNPDGRRWTPDAVIRAASDVGILVVDESFADAVPEVSVLPALTAGNVLVLRSFGKFFGLAGLRLGFVFGADELLAALRAMTGPWPVSGPAIEIGQRALADTSWQQAARARITRDALRLDTLATGAGWRLAGGTPLFRLYETGNAAEAQARLAGAHVWSRVFPYSERLIRLGLPDGHGWDQVAAALSPG